MADRVGVMRDGRLEKVATPGELYARPATTFVLEFVGPVDGLVPVPVGEPVLAPRG